MESFSSVLQKIHYDMNKNPPRACCKKVVSLAEVAAKAEAVVKGGADHNMVLADSRPEAAAKGNANNNKKKKEADDDGVFAIDHIVAVCLLHGDVVLKFTGYPELYRVSYLYLRYLCSTYQDKKELEKEVRDAIDNPKSNEDYSGIPPQYVCEYTYIVYERYIPAIMATTAKKTPWSGHDLLIYRIKGKKNSIGVLPLSAIMGWYASSDARLKEKQALERFVEAEKLRIADAGGGLDGLEAYSHLKDPIFERFMRSYCPKLPKDPLFEEFLRTYCPKHEGLRIFCFSIKHQLTSNMQEEARGPSPSPWSGKRCLSSVRGSRSACAAAAPNKSCRLS